MVAVDAAQSALRLGAKEVTIVALETKETMPAYAEDLMLAGEEGIKVIPSCGVKRITGVAGRVSGIELKACTSVFDEAGGFNPCMTRPGAGHCRLTRDCGDRANSRSFLCCRQRPAHGERHRGG